MADQVNTGSDSAVPRRPGVYLLLASVVLANVAAFSNRAVYIDEHLFLNVARMTREWGVLASGEWLSFGIFYPLSAHTHTPLGEYCLALLFEIFERFDESTFRLSFASVFSILAAWSFYSLSRRVAANPCLLTLLFIASPAVFVFSQTLMMDMPMLALFLAGLHWYLKGAEGLTLRLAAAAFSFTFSVAFGYAALVPLACLLGIALVRRRPVRELVAIAAPFVSLAVWVVALTVHYGELPFLRTARQLAGGGSVTQNMLALPAFLGGVTVFPWLVLLIGGGFRKRARINVAIASVVVAVVLSVFVGWISKPYVIWYVFLASAGVALTLRFAAQIPGLIQSGRVLDTFIALSFPGVLLFFLFVGEFISARYLLLGIPALYLAMFRHAGKKQLSVLLGTTAALSVALAVADYRFVNAYRDWVSTNIPSLQEEGFRVWNAGESGLRFYLEELGAASLSGSDRRPRSGDLLVRQAMFRYSLPERIETMLVPLKTWELKDAFPIRTFNPIARAGFHGSGLGLVPFVFSRAPHDVLEIAQITPLADVHPGAVWSPDGPFLVQDQAEVVVPMKVPPDSRIEYELEGSGSIEVHAGHATLRKGQANSIVWRNLRIVPRALADSGATISRE